MDHLLLKLRIPYHQSILETLGQDAPLALDEIENVLSGGDCHETTAHLIHCSPGQLPSNIPRGIEPPWLQKLQILILKHRLTLGV